jgi:hypothetical protein
MKSRRARLPETENHITKDEKPNAPEEAPCFPCTDASSCLVVELLNKGTALVSTA